MGKKQHGTHRLRLKLFTKTDKEGEKMHNIYSIRDAQCYCSLAANKCLASALVAATWPTSHGFSSYFHMMSYILEYPFAQFVSAVLCLSPPSSLCIWGPRWQGSTRCWETVQHCSTTTKTLVCYQYYFSLKSRNIASYRTPWRKSQPCYRWNEDNFKLALGLKVWK